MSTSLLLQGCGQTRQLEPVVPILGTRVGMLGFALSRSDQMVIRTSLGRSPVSESYRIDLVA